MVILSSLLFGAALCSVMLSFAPWVQANMRWMTGLKFFVFVGALAGGALLYLIARLGNALERTFGG